MPIQDFLRDNSRVLTRAGLGLLAGKTPNEQFANAVANVADERQFGQVNNKTVEYLQKTNPDLAMAVQNGIIPANEAFKLAVEQRTKKVDPKAGLMSVGKAIYNASTGEWITPPAGVGGADDTEYGLNPQYGTDANGNPVILQLSKGGTSKQTMLPEGIQLSKEPIKLDAGTHFVLLDPITRQPVGQIPKDIAGAAAAEAGGKALGGDQATLASMQSKMPGLEQTIAKLDGLAEKATYTTTGRVVDAGRAELGLDPRAEAVARAEYIATVDNQILPLLRDTFGAQFTQKEGETLRATLGDPNRSPKEKQAVLRSFIEQKRRDVEALSVRTGVAPAGAGPSVEDPLGIR